jgi:hypothetical protein
VPEHHARTASRRVTLRPSSTRTASAARCAPFSALTSLSSPLRPRGRGTLSSVASRRRGDKPVSRARSSHHPRSDSGTRPGSRGARVANAATVLARRLGFGPWPGPILGPERSPRRPRSARCASIAAARREKARRTSGPIPVMSARPFLGGSHPTPSRTVSSCRRCAW